MLGVLAAMFWLVSPCFAQTEPRLALVIEQEAYSGSFSRIEKAPEEANLIESALRQIGFTVTRRSNLTKNGLATALSSFRADLEQAGPQAVGFVYYTGHGAQHPGTGDSFLLGVNTPELRAASDLFVYGLDMRSQRDGFAATGAKAVFLVFDACRNIPAFSDFKANVKGITRVEARPDMLIAYATSLNDVAEEGVYAPILAEELVRTGQTADVAFGAAQRRVANRTGRGQLPWMDNLLYNEVCFAGCAAVFSREDQKMAAKLYDDAVAATENEQFKEATEYLQKACDLKYAMACNDLGGTYWDGVTGVEQDLEKAANYIKQACSLSFHKACVNLGIMYQEGEYFQQDYGKSKELYESACRGGVYFGCRNLGRLYEMGWGVAKDLLVARELYEKACDSNLGIGCHDLGELYENGVPVSEGENPDAIYYYEKGCALGDLLSCSKLIDYKRFSQPTE